MSRVLGGWTRASAWLHNGLGQDGLAKADRIDSLGAREKVRFSG